ncbi:Uncharacterised protein [Streptococcus criceti]|uniref:hypothetical protein n=1 Tax=Streptococcus criceti TaxID=1333 RepID=UPI000225DE06|nr:hypothetical protein [Streptococcus criceti]SUN43663.1 Uncharacterised protein [Streptococcus criceti]
MNTLTLDSMAFDNFEVADISQLAEVDGGSVRSDYDKLSNAEGYAAAACALYSTAYASAACPLVSIPALGGGAVCTYFEYSELGYI